MLVNAIEMFSFFCVYYMSGGSDYWALKSNVKKSKGNK